MKKKSEKVVESFVPRETGNRAVLGLHGMLVPFLQDEAYLVRPHGDAVDHLPMFSNREALESAAKDGLVRYDAVKQVDDPAAFLALLVEAEPRLCVAVDLRRTETGTVRYMLVDPAKPKWVGP